MQVRAMKGVRAVLERSAEGAAEPGIWLSLSTLLELPFDLPIRLELLRWLLASLECHRPAPPTPQSRVGGDCCAGLLAALVEAELGAACDHLERGAWPQGRCAWQAAVERHRQLLQLRPEALARGQLMDGLIQVLARMDQALTHRQWRPPTSPLDNAQVHADAAALLQQIRDLDQPLPHWFEVVEEGLLRRGALALLQQSSGRCRRAGITLLLRHSLLHPPVAEWAAARLELAVLGLLEDLDQSSHPVADLQALVEALASLGALVGSDRVREQVVQQALALARGCLELAEEATEPLGLRLADELGESQGMDPEQIGELVEDWLSAQAATRSPLTVELVWIPGARPIPHGQGQLALNLAALPRGNHRDPSQLELLLAALRMPLLRARPDQGIQLQPAPTSLLASLQQVWAGGGTLAWNDCQLLAQAQAAWEASAEAAFPEAHLAPGCCVVQPSATQLATLRCWLMQRDQLDPALATIRRHHHDSVFMRMERANTGTDQEDVLATLCALHLDEGFYAGATAPMASLEAWANWCLVALGEAQVVIGPQGISGSGWAVLQGVMQLHNHLPELVSWAQDEHFYRLLANREVVVVSAAASLIEEQHRSGRAFGLFRDLEIAPYGLRTVVPPASRYPGRPHRSFEASLAACLDELEGLAQERPFSVLLCVAGAYDLPLCHAVRERYGASCVAIGAALHARFGIEEPCSADWRRQQRRADHWRRIC